MLDKTSVNKKSSTNKKKKTDLNNKKVKKPVKSKSKNTTKKDNKKSNDKVKENKKIVKMKKQEKINEKPAEKNPKKMIILISIVTLSLIIIGALYYFLETPQFNITSIVVTGNSDNKVTSDEIIAKSGVSIGKNVITSMFKVDKKNILTIPYVSTVKVSFKLPSELVLNIAERKSVYFAFDKDKNVYYRLDENGIVLEECNSIELKQQEILVSGITFDDKVQLGSRINDIDYSKLLVYKKIEEGINSIMPDEHITKIGFENSLTNIYLNDKIEVILPNDTNLTYNLNFLKDILHNVGDVQGTIDMTKDNPTFISF